MGLGPADPEHGDHRLVSNRGGLALFWEVRGLVARDRQRDEMASRYGRLTHASRLVRRVQRKNETLASVAGGPLQTRHAKKGSRPRNALATTLDWERRAYSQRKRLRSKH